MTTDLKRLPYRMKVREIYPMVLLDSDVRLLSNRASFESAMNTSSMLLREAVVEVLTADIGRGIGTTISI